MAGWICPKILTDENARLKKLLAEAMPDNAMSKDLNSNKWRHPARSSKRWLTFVQALRSISGGRVR